MSLRDTQTRFMNYILAPQGGHETFAIDGEGDSAEFSSLVAEQSGIGVEQRLGIYANAYRARLRETVDTDHEMLGLYLGDELFEKMVAGYIDQNPSAYHSLRLFCDALPDFLSSDDFFSQYPVLADLARFERRLLNAFDASECDRASFGDLQAIAPQLWPQIQFRFHPSLQIFSCGSNAVESWQALKQGEAPPAPDYSSERSWLLWRGSDRVSEFLSLAPYEVALLEGFIHGNNFALQCECMLEWFSADAAPGEVLQSIQLWFGRGMVRSVVVERS